MWDVCEGLTNFARSFGACPFIMLLEVEGQRPGEGWEPSPCIWIEGEVASGSSPASIVLRLCRKIFGQHAKSMPCINFAKYNWFLSDPGRKVFVGNLYLLCGILGISSVACVQLQIVEI